MQRVHDLCMPLAADVQAAAQGRTEALERECQEVMYRDVSALAGIPREHVIGILPAASVRAARYALALPGITHLAVRDRGSGVPLGVITVNEVGDPTRPLDKE